jgi:hypothetical protein
MKASDLSLDGNVSFLFKSSPGFGKTLAAASFAVEGPVYLSYWDKKSPIELKTYFTEKRFGSLAKTILDNIEYDVYDSSNAGEYLNKIIGFLTDCRYFAIVNDSITFMTSAAVNWSLNFGKDKKVFKKLKDILPDWDEYKVETSLVSQCIDLSRKLPCHVIWTAHPLPQTRVEGSGASMRVTKANSIVSYGAKVAGIVPGSFTEIYHFSQQSSWGEGKSSKKYIVNTEAVGDEYAKSPLLGNYVSEFDITDKLFYKVWKELIDKSRGIEPKKVEESIIDIINPANPQINNPFNPQPNQWKT